MTDTITAVVFLAPWGLWAAWELVLLWRRRTSNVQTISMSARELGWRLNSLVYLWAALGSHWWWNTPKWATVTGSVIFWLVAVVLLVEDAILWRRPRETWPRWLKWQRWPFLWFAVGIPAGRFLFPQQGVFPWE